MSARIRTGIGFTEPVISLDTKFSLSECAVMEAFFFCVLIGPRLSLATACLVVCMMHQRACFVMYTMCELTAYLHAEKGGR